MIWSLRGFFLTSLLVVSSCTSQSVTLVHPQSGASAKCDASGFGSMSVVVESTVEECVKRVEKDGYIPVERLTAGQRVDLERRGLLPKK